jgi:hypothetical protein
MQQHVCLLTAGASTLAIYPDGHIVFSHEGISRWESPGPLCILHYFDRQHPRAEVLAIPAETSVAFGTAGTPSLSAQSELAIAEMNEHEAVVQVSIPQIDIAFPLRFTLHEDGSGFAVRLDDEDIVEAQAVLYRILNIEILPQFGAAVTGECGYLVLPNWFGCRTNFDKTYPREVRQTVYSSNDQWNNVCNMAVFGMQRAQGTLCGIISHGDNDAQLISRVHWEGQQLNSTHPALVFRWEQQDARLAGPREVRYSFASPHYADGEGYVFIGKEYRRFLYAERGLQSWEQKAARRPEAIDYLDRFFLKIFMAYKEPRDDGHGHYHAATTFAQVRDILEACLARGMKRLAVMLVGWGLDGHDGAPPTRFPVDERLGGERGMRDLLAWCREQDILLGVHDSYGMAYSCSPEFDTDDLIRHRTGEYWASVIWSGGRSHMICPAVYVDKHVKRDISHVAALGMHGHHHLDAVGSFMTCHAPAHPMATRTEFINQVRKMFEFASETLGSVSTEYPFGPYFDVVDGLFHSYSTPYAWHLASPVGRYLFDGSIPLLTIVLHGSVNCCEHVAFDDDYLLKLFDIGVSPQYEFSAQSSSEFEIPAYESAADKVAEVYQCTYGTDGLLPRLARLTIEARWELVPGVNMTRYSDGTTITVNYNTADYAHVPARSYLIEALDVERVGV